ncbi:unnamed protein product [Nesidiocoris tenuis]|uniref:Uncharacterized protein n=2 Tax=Nesidiocoris tenuis TaxID=355587 RepID=A0A6H5HMV2_9HEMI|nr:NADH-ubiquinone oxidoreductase ashi subunit [Nesidiocoris tenuis]CAB0018219.1 unnamed protein product [Nesidiocoris tenuis]
MALLKPSLLFSLARRSIASSQTLSHWNKDWKPGAYPKTEEERIAAAKKYNLLPQEYKPIPNDAAYPAGDYPDLKPYSADGRDPHYPWDYPEYRRNFNEAVPEEFNLYGFDRINVEEKLRYPMWKMLLGFVCIAGGIVVLCDLSEDTFFMPAMPRHMPAPGVTYYHYPSSSSDQH